MHHSPHGFPHQRFARQLEGLVGQLSELTDHLLDWVCRDEHAAALAREQDSPVALLPARAPTEPGIPHPPDEECSPLAAQADRGISGLVVDHEAGMAYFTMGVPLPPRLLCLVAALAAQARGGTSPDGFPAFRSPEELAAAEPSLRPTAIRQLVSRLRTIPGMNRGFIQTRGGRYRIRLRGDGSFITIPPAGRHGAERTTATDTPACDSTKSAV